MERRSDGAGTLSKTGLHATASILSIGGDDSTGSSPPSFSQSSNSPINAEQKSLANGLLAPIESINWHITSSCNYTCKFCFARNRGEEIHDLTKIAEILAQVKKKGIEKITFAGGEPLMHSQMSEILHLAKEEGLVTCIVTNGSLMDCNDLKRMKDDLDWIGLSIDSQRESIEKQLGRGNGQHVQKSVDLVKSIHKLGIQLKINTVVTKMNYRERIGPFIESLAPHRWKVFQYLHMSGCNDEYRSELEITSEEFDSFLKNHRDTKLQNGGSPVFERNEDMMGSYLMISPDGQLTSDKNGVYSKIGWPSFLKGEIADFVDCEKYRNRGGKYPW